MIRASLDPNRLKFCAAWIPNLKIQVNDFLLPIKSQETSEFALVIFLFGPGPDFKRGRKI